MLPRSNGIVWMDNEQPNDEALSWPPPPRINNDDEDEMNAASLSTFKSMLEMSNTTDCSFMNNNAINPLYNVQQQQPELFTSNLLFNPLDSCSPSQPQPFPLDPCSFLPPPKPYLFDNGSCYEQPGNFFQSQDMLPLFNNGLLSCLSQLPGSEFVNSELGYESYDVFPNSRSKVLRQLDVLPQVGAQPTLFQKRAAAATRNVNLGDLDAIGTGKKRKRTGYDVDEEDEEYEVEGGGGGDVSNLNYDSDEKLGVLGISGDGDDNCGGGDGDNSNANSSVTVGGGGGYQKGKKKGMPAKNLMAERRRRKKLNDRLYMLRSVVPKISKVVAADLECRFYSPF